MYTYDTIPDALIEIVNTCKRKGEIIRVSKPILYENKKYYEVNYFKKNLFMFQNILSGFLILDEKGNPVNDKNLIRVLSEMFHYCGIIYDTSRKSYRNALKSDEQLKNESREYSGYRETLKYLVSEGITDTENVKYILENIPGMREEANNTLKTLIEKAEEYNNKDGYLTDSILHELLGKYDDIMIMGFKRVKLINSASSSLNRIKGELLKKRKSIKIRMDKKLQNNLLKLESVINFFINILSYYGDVINYSEQKYIKSIHSREEEKIEKKLNLLRSKK